nr:hypothetical protein [Runella slithyformis]
MTWALQLTDGGLGIGLLTEDQSINIIERNKQKMRVELALQKLRFKVMIKVVELFLFDAILHKILHRFG